MATAKEYQSLPDLKAAIAEVWPSPGMVIAVIIIIYMLALFAVLVIPIKKK